MAERPNYLTERQKEILDFILEFQRDRGVSPTHREICEHFGYSSYGTVYKHLKLLQEKGFLRREWNQKRGIEVVDRQTEEGSGDDLPFFGRIAAGQPIEALPGDERIGVPGHLIGARRSDHYVLEVVGDSMIDEGIHEGDLVVVQRQEVARPGEMVVALVGSDATLKRFHPEGDQVRLQPANKNMEPIYVSARELRIQGVAVGLMRRFE
ncbi:MAG: transcriptional repressor LexA [Acidobacteriota bacterium]